MKTGLIRRSSVPLALETPIELLDTWITPNNRFFVRCHTDIPDVDLDTWKLRISGLVDRPLEFDLDDLHRMPAVSHVVTLECSGSGRSGFDPPTPGLRWEKGAVGTARWTGVSLAMLLARCGVRDGGRHLLIEAADRALGDTPAFTRSVPLDKAVHPDTLLAYDMNGEPLPVEHGHPLRLIVPGWSANHAMKWVTRLTVVDREHDGHFMRYDYRVPARRVRPGAQVSWEEMTPITTMVVKSLITAPHDGTALEPGPVAVEGIAYAGEAAIRRVEVSFDDGLTWEQATMGRDTARYAWRRWTFTRERCEPGRYRVVSRARDEQGRTQPLVQEWNPSGHLWNVVDRITVTILPGSTPRSG